MSDPIDPENLLRTIHLDYNKPRKDFFETADHRYDLDDLWKTIDKLSVGTAYPNTREEFITLSRQWVYALIPQFFQADPTNKDTCKNLWDLYQEKKWKTPEEIPWKTIAVFQDAQPDGKKIYKWYIDICRCGMYANVQADIRVFRNSWEALLQAVQNPTLEGVVFTPYR